MPLKRYSIQYPEIFFQKGMTYLEKADIGEHFELDFVVGNSIPLRVRKNRKLHYTIYGTGSKPVKK